MGGINDRRGENLCRTRDSAPCSDNLDRAGAPLAVIYRVSRANPCPRI